MNDVFDGMRDIVIKRRIDNKHHVQLTITTAVVEGKAVPRIDIVKTTNGQPIPDEEPMIIFRGRDYLSIPLLMRYRELCIQDRTTEYQLQSLDSMIKEFRDFATKYPERMKQPGVTLGK